MVKISKSAYVLTLLMLQNTMAHDGVIIAENKARNLAPLVYPVAGTFKVIVGYAVPVQISNRILVYGQNIQFQYSLPQDPDDFAPYFEGERRHRHRRMVNDERATIYKILQNDLGKVPSNGTECLKKDICEVASTRLQNNSLLAELLHLLLTPTYHNYSSVDAQYAQAAEIGRQHKNCSSVYNECPPGHSLLDKMSSILI